MSNLSKLALMTAALLVVAGVAALFSYASDDSGDGYSEASVAQNTATDRLITDLQERLSVIPDDSNSLDELGFAYLQKARETGDPSLYGQAEGVFQQSLNAEPGRQTALIGLSSVALARHDFSGALTFADHALAAGPETPDPYAARGDALMELGRYDEAVEAFQRMVDLRPDLGAYVRVSYARELHGELDGAVEAMQLAVEAAGPKGENAAWVRMQLGNLYFGRGDLDAALRQYDSSIAAFPGYVHALAGQARVAAARGELGEAAALYEQATARIPVVQYIVALGDVYLADGKAEEAQQQYDLVQAINQLYQANGVNTDLEIALYYADHDTSVTAAVSQAESVYEASPSVAAADVLAWSLYKSGDAAEAKTYIDEALRLGTMDAAIEYHAGLIYGELGDEQTAREHLERALEINPHFSVLQGPLAEQALEELGA